VLFVGDSPPGGATPGQTWWDSTGAQLYIYYNDGSSTQWVPAAASPGGGNFLPLAGGTISGNLVVSGTTTLNGLVGTQTNDNAQAGWVGEYMSSIVSSPGVTLTNNVAANVTTLALTAGDWDVDGELWVAATGTGSLVNIVGGLTTTSATPPGAPADNAGRTGVMVNGTAPVTVIDTVGPIRLSLAATTTVYLVAQAGFGATACTAYGKLRARRRR